MDDHHGHHDHSHHGHHMDILNATVNATATTIASVASALVTTVATALTQAPNENNVMNNPVQHDHMNHGSTEMPGAHEGHDVGDMHMTMQMYFYIGKTATILFKEWNVDSIGGMIGSVIGIILMGILYEGLKFLREHLSRQYYSKMSYSTCTVSGKLESSGRIELHKVTQNRMLSWHHILQTGLHIAQVLLGYFLMFIFMTYNVWLCLAILIGSGIGYFCFGWKKATLADISDHCH